MKSGLAGCSFGLSRLRFLAASPSISAGGDAVIHACWVCASASFARKKFVLNVPSITSVWGATPSGFNFVYFTACHMGL